MPRGRASGLIRATAPRQAAGVQFPLGNRAARHRPGAETPTGLSRSNDSRSASSSAGVICSPSTSASRSSISTLGTRSPLPRLGKRGPQHLVPTSRRICATRRGNGDSMNVCFPHGYRPVADQRRPVRRARHSLIHVREPVSEQAREVVPPLRVLSPAMRTVVPVQKGRTASPPSPVNQQRLDHEAPELLRLRPKLAVHCLGKDDRGLRHGPCEPDEDECPWDPGL